MGSGIHLFLYDVFPILQILAGIVIPERLDQKHGKGRCSILLMGEIAHHRNAVAVFEFRGSLNIQCIKSGEKIFRQMKQNSARVVHPTRRDFVKYHGKDSANFSCDEFLEIPFIPINRLNSGA